MIEIRKADAVLKKFIPAAKPRPGIRYIPSQFAVPFELDGASYVYHTMTRQFLKGILPKEVQAGEGCDELIKDLFLVPEGKDECAFYQSVSTVVRAFERKKGVRHFTILPTFGCNARCVYCYEEGFAPVSMTPETVEQTIRYIIGHRSEGKVYLDWFGGEPLMGIPVIDRICAALREADVDYESSMISNGSFINDDVIGKMTGPWNLRQIQISMDGAESDYKARKKYYAYRDTYHRVIHAVDRMSEAGIRVSVRCNVDIDNWNGTDRFLSDLSEGISHKNNVNVYFCPLNEVRLGPEALELWEKIVAALPAIQKKGFGIQIGTGTGGGLRATHCMADSGNVVITPDGALFPCEHCPEESRFGDIFHGVTDPAAREEFCRTDKVREKCRKCPYLPECTSFANCPIQDSDCRAVREMLERVYLTMLLSLESPENAEGASLC